MASVTEEVYGYIKERKFKYAIKILIPHSVTDSRQVRSLLAYCYYQNGEFAKAAELFKSLGGDYKLYEAQCYYRAGDFARSQDALSSLNAVTEDSAKLQRALLFETETTSALPQGQGVDDLVFKGCMQFRAEDYLQAKQSFLDAIGFLGRKKFLLYNIAVCDFKLRDWKASLSFSEEILHASVREQSFVIEALNLKASVFLTLKDVEGLSATVEEFPPKEESELDAISLHNLALFNNFLSTRGSTPRPSDVVAKLEFLLKGSADGVQLGEEADAMLSQTPGPTLKNILVLLIDYEAFDAAADILADFPGSLSQEDFDFFEALILAETAPEEGVRRLDQLILDVRAKIEKHVKSLHAAKAAPQIKQKHDQYNDILDLYLRATLALARVFFRTEKYVESEKVLASIADYFSGNLAWRTNVGHVLFAQEKYKDAAKFYDMAVAAIREESGNILLVQAVVVANLCVSYVMISENDKAETLIREVEAQEDQAQEGEEDEGKSGSHCSLFHSTVINLVIGTLYCVKANWEFGLSRVIKAMDPVERRLNTEVWEYAKRVLSSFFFAYSKGCLLVKDSMWSDTSEFLDQVIAFAGDHKELDTVKKEARTLKLVFLKLRSN